MSTLIEAAMSGSASGDDGGLDEIINLGKKELRERRTEELTLDLPHAIHGLNRRGSD